MLYGVVRLLDIEDFVVVVSHNLENRHSGVFVGRKRYFHEREHGIGVVVIVGVVSDVSECHSIGWKFTGIDLGYDIRNGLVHVAGHVGIVLALRVCDAEQIEALLHCRKFLQREVVAFLVFRKLFPEMRLAFFYRNLAVCRH